MTDSSLRNLFIDLSDAILKGVEAIDERDKLLAKALSQEPCEDCISRQDAIRIAEQGQIQGYEWQFKELNKLPPVTPAKKAGMWIEERTYMKCPNCYDIWHYEENQTERFRYCPTCGRKLEVEAKE